MAAAQTLSPEQLDAIAAAIEGRKRTVERERQQLGPGDYTRRVAEAQLRRWIEARERAENVRQAEALAEQAVQDARERAMASQARARRDAQGALERVERQRDGRLEGLLAERARLDQRIEGVRADCTAQSQPARAELAALDAQVQAELDAAQAEGQAAIEAARVAPIDVVITPAMMAIPPKDADVIAEQRRHQLDARRREAAREQHEKSLTRQLLGAVGIGGKS